jgi:hypothetical protein
VVIYKGDAGYMTDAQKSAFDAYVKRGGGIVSLHDALCGPDPAHFANLVGGGKKHGEVNYTLEAAIPYTVVDKENPIMKDMSNVTIYDEAFYNLTWAKDPGIHVLATVAMPATRAPASIKAKSFRRSGPTNTQFRVGSPRGRSFGCRGTHTRTSRTIRSSGRCFAGLRGRLKGPLTNWSTTWRPRARRGRPLLLRLLQLVRFTPTQFFSARAPELRRAQTRRAKLKDSFSSMSGAWRPRTPVSNG